MLLDLSRMTGPRDHVDRRFDAEAFEQESGDFVVRAPVRLVFDVFKDKDSYRLAGRFDTVLELTCGRCLEPYPFPVEASFDVRYLPQAENVGEGEREVQADDLDAAYYRDDTIDLRQMLREQFYLAMPMKPLCRPDCRGLCPECGTNLNVTTCSCEPRWTDPRLTGLREWLDK